MKYYTGCGSRQTPAHILETFKNLAQKLAEDGYTLRSGGAPGADKAFENGVNLIGGSKEIYLPWKRFENNPSHLYNVSRAAISIAEKIHPAWDKCSQGARKLLGRNVYQVLGEDLNTPVNFVICWTHKSEIVGGTAIVLELAKEHNIPIYNFGNDSAAKLLFEHEGINININENAGYSYFF